MMSRKTSKNFTIAMFCLLSLGPLPVWSQTANGEITGAVTDTSGATVEGAAITVTNIATNVTRVATTNSQGYYEVPQLPIGSYTVNVKKAGFRSQEERAVPIDVQRIARLDFALAVGEVNQTVTVQAAGEEIQSQSAELGSTVSQKQAVDLPLNGRNFTQLLTLTPGVSPVNVSQGSGGFYTAVTNTANFVFPSINGQSNRSNFYMLDGVSDTGQFVGNYDVAPIIDTIQEWKTSTHNDTEFGGATGGYINVITKSGTNGLHGDAWEYLRNTAFDARNTFQPAAPVLHQNQYGLTVGGPVTIPKLYNGKNKTFFFFGWERFALTQPSNSYATVPTQANLSGDFSNLLALKTPVQLFDPNSTVLNANGTYSRTPYPNNQIPQSQLNAGAIAFAKALLPAPNASLGFYNYLNAVPVNQIQDTWSGRLDQTIGTKDQLFLRWTQSDLTTGSTQVVSTNPVTTDLPGINVAANWTHTFSPSTVLQLTFGRDHLTENLVATVPTLKGSTFSQAYGFNSNLTSFPNGYLVPDVTISSYEGGVGDNYQPVPTVSGYWEGKGNLTKVVGAHTFTMGGDYNTLGFQRLNYVAFMTFGPNATADPLGTSPGDSLASFVLGLPQSAEHRVQEEDQRNSGAVWGAYIQDSWKVTSRLTAILGLRYDKVVIPVNYFGGYNTLGTIDYDTGNYLISKNWPSCSQTGAAPCIPGSGLPAHVVVSPYSPVNAKPNNFNFAPRVGLAYRLNDKTAVRTGFGVFYDEYEGVTQGSQGQDTWPGPTGGWISSLALNGTSQKPSGTFENPDPTAVAGGGLPAPSPLGDVQWYVDPHNDRPYSMQWNIGIERQVSANTSLGADYVGSGSRHVEIGYLANTGVIPGPSSTPLYPYLASAYNDRALANANYNAFQFRFNRRYSSGLLYSISYTWSKAIDEGCDGLYAVEGCSVQNSYDIRADRSVASYDLTHVFAFSSVYDVPVGKGKRFSTGHSFLDHILGDWQINNIFTAHSGVPYTITSGVDTANTGGTQERPNLVGNPSLTNPSESEYFNTSAFALPVYGYGNLGRNTMRSPAFWNLDSSLFRQFPLWREGVRFEFRAEGFNVFNAQILGAPHSCLCDPAFGQITTTQGSVPGRVIQLAGKIIF